MQLCAPALEQQFACLAMDGPAHSCQRGFWLEPALGSILDSPGNFDNLRLSFSFLAYQQNRRKNIYSINSCIDYFHHKILRYTLFILIKNTQRLRNLYAISFSILLSLSQKYFFLTKNSILVRFSEQFESYPGFALLQVKVSLISLISP